VTTTNEPIVPGDPYVPADVAAQGADPAFAAVSRDWVERCGRSRYTYNFRALGRPIIQLPQDMVAMQELIWAIRPDLIIETGIAHGGSLMLSASMLALLDLADAAAAGELLDPAAPRRRVLGIDIDIRAHNRAAIEAHPLAARIDMIEGSSVDPAVVAEVQRRAAGAERVLVCLDSNHTHAHVLAELEAYASLTSVGSYCVVFDTVIEDLPAELFPDRPWGPGDNPKTAVHAWIASHPEFVIDHAIDHKLLLSVAPDGYLKRVR
jgi:cephalosporin hydroxylase